MTKNEYIVIPIATITRRRIPKDLVQWSMAKQVDVYSLIIHYQVSTITNSMGSLKKKSINITTSTYYLEVFLFE